MEQCSPCHMYFQRAGFCDVAIVDHYFSSGIVFKQTLPTLTPPGKNCLINFTPNGGTGFIIALSEKTINDRRKLCGLVLTAAHVVCDYLTFKPLSSSIGCLLENGESRAAYFVDCFLSKSSEDFVSQLTGSRYCLSGDIAIMIVTLKSSDMVDVYPLAESVNIGEDCFVAGFPKRSRNPVCATPQLIGETEKRIIEESKQIFCNFRSKVYSLGKVEASSNLIEISCSTTNGMSGGPIVSGGEIVGVYVGGPPLPGQWELYQMMLSIAHDIYTDFETNINKLESYTELYKCGALTQVLLFAKLLLNSIQIGYISESDKLSLSAFGVDSVDQLKYELKKALYSCLYKGVWTFKDKELYRANMGVSVNCEIFNTIKQKMRNFLAVKAELGTIKELISLI